MLKNAPFLITIGVDTAENEPRKESWVVARTGVSILIAGDGGVRPRGGDARLQREVPPLPHRHDTSLFPRLVLGCIDADLCK